MTDPKDGNDSMESREQSLQKDVLLVATAAVSLINGASVSPLFDPVFFLLRPFVAQIASSPLVLFYMTSIFLSAMTLLLAGVPAAIYERLRGETDSTPISIGIWLIATILLSIPGLMGLLGAGQ
ncbi:MAG: hypothetical protein ACKVP7_00955 [Hyphomicrobiaceae bacterium]